MSIEQKIKDILHSGKETWEMDEAILALVKKEYGPKLPPKYAYDETPAEPFIVNLWADLYGCKTFAEVTEACKNISHGMLESGLKLCWRTAGDNYLPVTDETSRYLNQEGHICLQWYGRGKEVPIIGELYHIYTQEGLQKQRKEAQVAHQQLAERLGAIGAVGRTLAGKVIQPAIQKNNANRKIPNRRRA